MFGVLLILFTNVQYFLKRFHDYISELFNFVNVSTYIFYVILQTATTKLYRPCSISALCCCISIVAKIFYILVCLKQNSPTTLSFCPSSTLSKNLELIADIKLKVLNFCLFCLFIYNKIS